jgi:hypothetical protein
LRGAAWPVCDRVRGSWGPASPQKTSTAAWWQKLSSSSYEDWFGNLRHLWLCRSGRARLEDYAKAVYLDRKADQPGLYKHSNRAHDFDPELAERTRTLDSLNHAQADD